MQPLSATEKKILGIERDIFMSKPKEYQDAIIARDFIEATGVYNQVQKILEVSQGDITFSAQDVADFVITKGKTTDAPEVMKTSLSEFSPEVQKLLLTPLSEIDFIEKNTKGRLVAWFGDISLLETLSYRNYTHSGLGIKKLGVLNDALRDYGLALRMRIRDDRAF